MRRRWNTPEVAVKVGLTGAGFLALGVLDMRATGVTGPDTVPFWLIVIGSGTLGGLFLVWRHGHAGSSGQVHRWARRSRRNDGVASAWAVLRVASAFAVRRRACVLRPSYAGIPWFVRWWAPTTVEGDPLADGHRLGHSAHGAQPPPRSLEDPGIFFRVETEFRSEPREVPRHSGAVSAREAAQ